MKLPTINKKILKTHDYKLNNNNAARIAKKDFNTICKHYTHIKPKNIIINIILLFIIIYL